MVRNPELEGVADGEVCGLGVLAETVRTFLHWVPIKLGTNDALRLCVSCGDALAQEVDMKLATPRMSKRSSPAMVISFLGGGHC